MICNNQWIMELTFVGGIGGSLGRAIVDVCFSDFTKVPIEGETSMPSGNVNVMNSDSASKSGSSGGSKSGSTISPEDVDKVIKKVDQVTKVFMAKNQISVDQMIKINEASRSFTLDKLSPF